MISAFFVPTHRPEECVCSNSHLGSRQTCLSFVLSVSISVLYVGNNGIFIYHLMHLHFKSCQHCFLLFMPTRFVDKNDFLRFVHRFTVGMYICIRISIDSHFYFPHFFSRVIHIQWIQCTNEYTTRNINVLCF